MRATWGAVAHVFVAVAIAVPLCAAALAIGGAIALEGESTLSRWLLALVGTGVVAVVAWATMLPPVRQVEVATARALLDVSIPDVPDPRERRSRLAGAAWFGLLAAVGSAVGPAMLYLLPTGVALIAHPLTGDDNPIWPDRYAALPSATGWSAAWVPGLGLLTLALLVGIVLVTARLLGWLAPKVIGPTGAERLTLAAARERDLARANALARDVHDTIGHALTAMTVQATVARRLLHRDPSAADVALSEIERLGRRAQADVDDVVGVLRTGDRPPEGRADGLAGATDPASRIRALADGVPMPVDLQVETPLSASAEIAEVVVAVVREGLTNAVRYGGSPATVTVSTCADRIDIAVGNPLGTSTLEARPGRGLIGLRERLLMHGGTLTAGREPDEHGGEWWLRAQLPTR